MRMQSAPQHSMTNGGSASSDHWMTNGGSASSVVSTATKTRSVQNTGSQNSVAGLLQASTASSSNFYRGQLTNRKGQPQNCTGLTRQSTTPVRSVSRSRLREQCLTPAMQSPMRVGRKTSRVLQSTPRGDPRTWQVQQAAQVGIIGMTSSSAHIPSVHGPKLSKDRVQHLRQ